MSHVDSASDRCRPDTAVRNRLGRVRDAEAAGVADWWSQLVLCGALVGAGDHVGTFGGGAGAVLQAHRNAVPDTECRSPHDSPGCGTATRASGMVGHGSHRMPLGEVHTPLLAAKGIGRHSDHHSSCAATSYADEGSDLHLRCFSDPELRNSTCGIVPCGDGSTAASGPSRSRSHIVRGLGGVRRSHRARPGRTRSPIRITQQHSRCHCIANSVGMSTDDTREGAV